MIIPEPPLERRQTIGYYLAFFSLGVVIASLGPTIPALAERMNTAPESLGFLFSARSLGYLAGSLLVGQLYDRVSGNRLLAGMLLLVLVSVAIVPAAGGAIMLTLAMLVSGAGLGGLDVGSNTLMAWTHRKKASPYLNAMFFFAGIGSALIPLYLGWALEFSGLALAYVGTGLAALPAIIWLIRVPSPVNEPQAGEAGRMTRNWLPVAAFGAFFFVFVGIEVTFGGWIYTYTLARHPGEVLTASLVTSALYQAVTVGRLLAIPLAARLHPRAMLWINIAVGVLSMAFMILLPSGVGTWVGSIGLGLSLASMFPTTFALASRQLRITGSMAGVLWASGSGGAIILPWLVGLRMEADGPEALPVMILGVMSLGVLIYTFIFIRFRAAQTTPA